jgi:hypothetical protein
LRKWPILILKIGTFLKINAQGGGSWERSDRHRMRERRSE